MLYSGIQIKILIMTMSHFKVSNNDRYYPIVQYCQEQTFGTTLKVAENLKKLLVERMYRCVQYMIQMIIKNSVLLPNAEKILSVPP